MDVARLMNAHDHATLAIGVLFEKHGEQVCMFLSNPFTVDENGKLVQLPDQPSAEEKAKLVRDAEAHRDLAALYQGVLPADGVDDPEKH